MLGLDAGGRSTEEEALQARVPELQDRHRKSVTRNVSGCNRLTAGCNERSSTRARSGVRLPLIRSPPLGRTVSLTLQPHCPTLYDMKTSILTIRLDKDLDDLLTKASRRSGRNRSEVAREALRRQLRISQFEALRRKIMPFAEARGYLTDEDVFAEVS